MSSVSKGIYRHYKGGLYRVIGVAKHSETLDDVVIYECMYKDPTSKTWVRPVSVWNEKLSFDGKIVKRFTFVRKK